MDKITVAVVSWYSSSDINNLFESIKANTIDSELEFIVCDNTNGKDKKLDDELKNDYHIILHEPIFPDRWKRKHFGSFAHSSGLNKLLTLITTEFSLFIDPDCIVLTKGWDVACKQALINNCISIGAPYHSRKITKYHNFPSPIFTFFRTSAFKEVGADWTPYLLPASEEICDQIKRIFAIIGAQIGERLYGQLFYTSEIARLMRKLFGNSSKDTGWRIPQKVSQCGYRSEIFTSAVTSDQVVNSFADNKQVNDLMNEYELFLWQGIPLLTHFYGSGHKRKGNIIDSANRWKMLSSSVAVLCEEFNFNHLAS